MNLNNLEQFYGKNYKILMTIPIVITILATIFVIGFYIKTGDIIHKDVSLKGGITATVYTENQIDLNEIKNNLNIESDIRKLSDFTTGKQIGFMISVSEITSEEIKNKLEQTLNLKLTQENYSVEETGSKLGESFFKQLIIAVILAFILMGIVVFITFRTFVPSIAVILAAFTDIIVPLAIIDLVGMKISAAGIVAFLLIIGYSIDTDILLTTWSIKRTNGGRLFIRMVHSMKTGLTMTLAALVVMLIGLIFSNSVVVKEIFTIILIALVVDVFATYLTNSGILWGYCKKKGIQ